MKRLVIAGLIVLFAAPLAVAQSKGRAKDEEAVKKVFADFAAAWAKGEAKGMSVFWTEDGDLINPAGRIARSRSEVEQLFASVRPTNPQKILFTETRIRFVGRNLAIYDGSFELPGTSNPEQKGLVTCVMVKKAGRWWILAARPMVPLGNRP